MPHRFLLWTILGAIFISGCSSVASIQNTSRQMGNLILAEPAPVSPQSQMHLVRLNQVLTEVQYIPDEQRAELLYQRGAWYDTVGLQWLAYHDFNTAIKLKPDMAEAHNYLGIHHTQNGDFLLAYESFDSTLDIDPSHDFAFLNRGIALYYAGKPKLAIDDLQKFYQKKANDPYRALWIYIAEREVDEEAAKLNLRTALTLLDPQNWATYIVKMYLGDISEQDLLNTLLIDLESNQKLNERLCEAYFYLGKYHNSRGDKGKASNYFKIALSTDIYQYVEHRYSRLELSLLRQTAFEQVVPQ